MDKNVLKNLTYGLYVIGCQDNHPSGCVVNTVFQITSNPLLLAVSINKDNYTNKVLKKQKKFSISILSEKTDPQIIGTFGFKSSQDINKFAEFKYQEKDNIPYLEDCCGNLICEVIDLVETTTHTLFIAEIKDMFNYSQDTPMSYKYYHEVLKGSSPKKAPTYQEEEIESEKTIWKCSICGYEVEMDELPEDFVCPICGQPAKVFKKK